MSEDKNDSDPKSTSSDDPICSICLDNVKNCSSINSCTHLFCFECIYKWSKVSNTCPLCQSRFTALNKIKERESSEENISDVNTKKRRSQRPAALKAAKRMKGNNRGVRIPFRDTRSYTDQDDVRFLIHQYFTHIGRNFRLPPFQRSRTYIDLTRENEENTNNIIRENGNEVICIDDDSDVEVNDMNCTVVQNIEDDSDDDDITLFNTRLRDNSYLYSI